MIEKLREEMIKEFEFSQHDVNRVLEIIYFIGIAEDLAWRSNGGVLREDVPIDDSLLNYLKQGLIVEKSSSNKNYLIYLLDEQGIKLFNEIILKEKDDEIIQQFKRDFDKINQRILALINTDLILHFEEYKISNVYEILLSNSTIGEQIRLVFNDSVYKISDILERCNLYVKITHFQSNRRSYTKKKFIKYKEIVGLLSKNVKDFTRIYKDIIDSLNERVQFYNRLTSSIKNPSDRENLGIHERECEKLVNTLNRKKITTQFNTSNPLYFKIIDINKFKSEIEELKQKAIDKITTPIIKFILNQTGNIVPFFETRGKEKDLDSFYGKLIALVCPECGGSLETSEDKEMYECKHCDTKFKKES